MFNSRENTLLRRALALYAGEHVLEKVLREGESFLVPNADTAELTMLYFDVASFAHVEQGFTADAIDQWRRAYADAVTSAIDEAGGTFDAFVGDDGSAWWSGPQHPSRALEGAKSLTRAMAALADHGKATGFPDVRLGIGIHTGRVALGNHGSKTRLRYSVMGDAVNVAARLCGLAREPGNLVVLSGATYDRIKDRSGISPLGDIPMKDGESRLKVYGLET